jgi:hypothetical protein
MPGRWFEIRSWRLGAGRYGADHDHLYDNSGLADDAN